MTFLTGTLLKLLTPVIAGALAFALTQFVKHHWTKLDEQPAAIKQAATAAWAYAFNVLASAVPEPICRDGLTFCEPPELAFSVIMSYALAVSLHGVKRRK